MNNHTLSPSRPPGRRSRKARAFSAEISRLLALEYTLEDIREALADAGIEVSKSTVQREAARLNRLSPTRPSQAVAIAHASTPRPSPAPPCIATSTTGMPAAVPPERRSGKDVAEEFRRSQSTNPLIRAKEQQR